MTGIANAPAFTGFAPPGGDDFSLDLAGPDAGGAQFVASGGSDSARGVGGGEPLPPGGEEACAEALEFIEDLVQQLQMRLGMAQHLIEEGHTQAARHALAGAKNFLPILENICAEFLDFCQGATSLGADRILSATSICRSLPSIEADIDRKLADLNRGMAIDLRPIGEAFGQILQLLGGIGRALGGGAWQN